MKTRKILTAFFAIALCVVCMGFLAPEAQAAEELASGTCDYGLTWVLTDDGVLTISGRGAIPDYNLSNNPAPWLDKRTEITEIVIKDGVTGIGRCAFGECTNLAKITIPDSVTNIGTNAFYNCKSLTKITIPDGVTTIGQYAFNYCTSLQEITLPFVKHIFWNSLHDIWYESPFGYLFGTLGGVSVELMLQGYHEYDGAPAMANPILKTYYIPSSLKSVTITSGKLPKNAFRNCTMLEYIELQSGVEGNASTFTDCTGLTMVNLGCGFIPSFSGCTNLTTVFIPRNASTNNTDIEKFWDCTYLWHVLYEGTEEEWNENISSSFKKAIGGKVKVHFECRGDEVIDPANKVCSICLASCDHQWGESVVKAEPDCETEGLIVSTCAICKCGKTESIPALGHTPGPEASCTENQVCTVCNAVLVPSRHIAEIIPGTSPGCEAVGSTEGSKCGRCGEILKTQEEIPALGHQYESGICVRCGGKDPSWIPGDANGDRAVNYEDALLILRYSIGLETLTPETLAACDVNHDGDINYSDALMILRASIGLETLA